MEDLDNLKTPDAYVRNYGVDVEQNVVSPQYGQIAVRIRQNTYQSTQLQMGLEQAKELHEKLGTVLAELGSAVRVGSMVRIITTTHNDLRGKVGEVDFIFASGNLQVGIGNEIVVVPENWVEVVQ